MKKREMRTPRRRRCRRTLFSGRRLKLSGEFEQSIDSKREHAEHQMRHDFAGPAHADEALRLGLGPIL